VQNRKCEFKPECASMARPLAMPRFMELSRRTFVGFLCVCSSQSVYTGISIYLVCRRICVCILLSVFFLCMYEGRYVIVPCEDALVDMGQGRKRIYWKVASRHRSLLHKIILTYNERGSLRSSPIAPSALWRVLCAAVYCRVCCRVCCSV